MSSFRVILIFILLSLLGLFVLPYQTVSLLPIKDKNGISISYIFADASPENVESEVTSFLENHLSAIKGLKSIESESRYEFGSIHLEFDEGVDLFQMKNEIGIILRNCYHQLPKSCSYPFVRFSSNTNINTEEPLLVYQVWGDYPLPELKEISNQVIQNNISQLQGVKKVAVHGAPEMVLRIAYDVNKLQANRLNKSNIINSLNNLNSKAVQRENITKAGQRYLVGIKPRINSLEDLRKITIANSNNDLIVLGNIADIYFEKNEKSTHFKVNGKNALVLKVFAEDEANKLLTGTDVKEAIDELNSQLPAGSNLTLLHDQTDFINLELNKIYVRSFISLMILALFILAIRSGVRYILVLFSSLIINVLLVSLILFVFKVHIHIYTLAGLSISFGIMIDNAVIMMDHYGANRNKFIITALIAISLTTVLALLAIFLLPDSISGDLNDFGLIIAICIVSSLFISFWFIPAMMNMFDFGLSQPSDKTKFKAKKWFIRYNAMLIVLSKNKILVSLAIILTFGVPVYLIPDKIKGDSKWSIVYNDISDKIEFKEKAQPILDKMLGGTVSWFLKNLHENSGFRDSKELVLRLNVKMDPSYDSDYLGRVLAKVEQELLKNEGIRQIFTTHMPNNTGLIELFFHDDYIESGGAFKVKNDLANLSVNWSGFHWVISGIGKPFTMGMTNNLEASNFVVRSYGYNLDQLNKQVEKLTESLVSNERIQDVNTNLDFNGHKEWSTKSLILKPDLLGLNSYNHALTESFSQIEQYKSVGYAKQNITLENKNHIVSVREKKDDVFSSYDLMNLAMEVDSAKFISLSAVSFMDKQKSVSSIYKYNRNYIKDISFLYEGSYKFGDYFLKDVLEKFSKTLPLGYKFEKLSGSWKWEEEKQKYGLLFLLLIAIFFVCSILFENIRLPLAVICVIPISFIGVFIGFASTEFYFDQGGYAAFLMLSGISVNAGILIMNDYLSNKNKGLRNPMLKALINKCKPIFITNMSTCLGLVPFLMGGDEDVFWFSMAFGTIAGLFFSVLAVFVFIPCFVIVDRKKTKLVNNLISIDHE
ncbi:efflux RND transporter permease subunit [Aureibacter tunicatorum]|uniref:Multidrug efflux pump subunit AcrB n=1 Tax=Aureibacter tunicatorum TaxID=866807 RepID=A0AAE3XST1_9BACT|nr:efflux RND transporter permease subunit [Aureibacter tunicatorum]MDR6241350.1 multidrug efflux pump subunit AcrB [Aureibacter tunicatorum]BDD03609.1 multidrug efflux pump protein [Aureibacter tunicatorum]